jgi:hypothetical protein
MGNLGKYAEQMKKSRAAGGGDFLRDGSYLLTVLNLKHDNGFKGTKFVAEFLVDEAEGYDSVQNEKGESIKVSPNAIGSRPSFVQLYDKFEQTAYGNVKAFLMALDGATEEEFDVMLESRKMKTIVNGKEEEVGIYDYIVGPDQPYRGAQIKASTFRKWTKNQKTLLVLPKWAHVEQTDEQITARRKELDSVPGTQTPPEAVPQATA